MPVTLYTEDEVEVYTRLLSRAYYLLRDDEPDESIKSTVLKEIMAALGWSVPPPMTGKPPSPAPSKAWKERQ